MTTKFLCLLLLLLVGVLSVSCDSGDDSAFTRSDYKTGNADFLAALDASLVRIFLSGKYDEIYSRWFSGSARRILTCEEDSSFFPFPTLKRNARGTLGRVVRTRHLKVGADFPFAPFEFFDNNGNVVGFEADLVAEIAVQFSFAYPGTTPFTWEFVQVPWDQALTQLNAGAYDLMANSITIASDYFGSRRVNIFNFTCGYLPDSPGILRGPLDWTTLSLTGFNDLNKAGVKIGYISGTPAATLIEGSQGATFLPLATKTAVADYDSLLFALDGDATHAPTVHVVFEGSANLAFEAKTRLAANPAAHVAYIGEFGNINIDAIAVRLDSY